MSVLRVKNERLEKLCRALHKGGKVTANDVEQVMTDAYFILILNWSFSSSSFALDFYEVIVDSVFGLIDYHLIEISSS